MLRDHKGNAKQKIGTRRPEDINFRTSGEACVRKRDGLFFDLSKGVADQDKFRPEGWCHHGFVYYAPSKRHR